MFPDLGTWLRRGRQELVSAVGRDKGDDGYPVSALGQDGSEAGADLGAWPRQGGDRHSVSAFGWYKGETSPISALGPDRGVAWRMQINLYLVLQLASLWAILYYDKLHYEPHSLQLPTMHWPFATNANKPFIFRPEANMATKHLYLSSGYLNEPFFVAFIFMMPLLVITSDSTSQPLSLLSLNPDY